MSRAFSLDKAGVELVDADVGIDLFHAVGGGIELLAANVAGTVNDLTLQVRDIHHIKINQADAPDTGSREIQAERRTQAARANHGYFGVLQFRLGPACPLRAESDGG